MEAQAARKTLHELIDKTKDEELLNLCLQLLEREMRRSLDQQDFFNTTESELKSRAEASITSISVGRSRSIHQFKEEIDQWKQRKSI